jgi:hypothetical protein
VETDSETPSRDVCEPKKWRNIFSREESREREVKLAEISEKDESGQTIETVKLLGTLFEIL